MGVKTIALLACVLPAGCYHGLGVGPDGDVGVGSDGAASDGAQTAAGSDTGDGDGDDDDACAAAAPDALRRLTGSQYARSVTALTGIELSAALLGLLAPVEPPLDAFENLADTLLVRQSDAEAYQRIAESVARERFSGDDATIAGWVGCASSEPTCLENFIERFTRLAYRRPVTATERANLRALADAAVDAGGIGPWAPWSTVVEAVLQSPKFVLVVEPSSEIADERLPLDDHQIATRLALALWDQIPDADLLDHADAGAFTDRTERLGIIAQMLDDPRAETAVRQFASRWFRVDAIDGADFVEAANGEAAALRADAKAEVLRLLDAHVVQGDLRELYTSQHAAITPALAAIYGVTPGEEVEFAPDDHRGGLFGTAGFLAMTSSGTHASPVQRGVFVRRVSLCSEPPPPPPGVPMDDATSDEHSANPACWGCHVALDPIGWGLDRYGPSGSLRTAAPDGRPLHESGYFDEGADLEFADAAQLGAAVLAHPSFVGCAAENAMKWFYAKIPRAAETCVAEASTPAFIAAEFNMRTLVRELVGDDAITQRVMPAAIEGGG